MRTRLMAAAVACLAVAGCSDTGPLAVDDEELLAAELVALVEETGEARDGGPGALLQRMVRAVRENGDADARRMLRQARVLRDLARIARQAGDEEAARAYATRSYHTLLGAIVLTYPNAPARVGGMVDGMLSRMRERLGDREAPRIRRVLRYAWALRERADAAERPAVALGLNLTAFDVLHRLVEYLRNGPEGAEAAAQEALGGLAG